MAKIENIADIKHALGETPNTATEPKEVQEFFSNLMTEDSRAKVTAMIDDFIKNSGLRYEEALLGFCDYSIAALVKSMVAQENTEEAAKRLDERFLTLRGKIAEVLNSVTDYSMGETIVTLLTFVTESLSIIAENEGTEA